MISDEAVDHAKEMASSFADGRCACCRQNLTRITDGEDGTRYLCRGCRAEFVNGDGDLEFNCRCGHIQCAECGSGAVIKRDGAVSCLDCGAADIGTLHAHQTGEQGDFRNTSHGVAILEQLRRGEECPCCGHWEVRHVPGATMGWACVECGAAAVHDEESEYLVACTCDDSPECVACGSHIITLEEESREYEIECEVCDTEVKSPVKA